MNQRLLAGLYVILIMSITTTITHAADSLVFFGSNATGPGKGFSVAHFDTDTGVLTKPQFAIDAESPSFFVIHPDGKHLYACNEVGKFHGTNGGGVSAYSIDPSGKLALINSQPTGGADTCHVSLDNSGKYLLCASYSGGNVAVFAIQPDGSIGKRTAFDQHSGSGPHPDRQKQAYAHSIRVDPSNHFAIACDLGNDKVYVYKFNEADGSLTPNDPPSISLKPGSGPRHTYFHPNGKFLFVSDELSCAVTVLAWDGTKGTLSEVQTISTLPPDFKTQNTVAEIEVHPSGKFLYVTNRGEDSVATFSIDQASGKLTHVANVPTKGKTPRNFALDPSGKWLLATNQNSGTAVVYKVDPETGKLTATGDPISTPGTFSPKFLIPQK